MRDFRQKLEEIRIAGDGLGELDITCEKAFGDALDDDLNISGAIAAVFDFIRETNKLMDNDTLGKGGAQRGLALLDRANAVTGLFGAVAQEETPAEILALVTERQQARRAKDFKRADEIRDQLLASGWVLEDTADGPRVKKA